MAKELRIDLEIGLDKARAALKQLQQEANQIARGRGNSGGGGSGGGGFGNLGFSAASAAAGAAAAAVAAVGAELRSLASRATELSQSASSATSQLGQLRSAVERSNISRDAAATSPAVVSLAKAAADFQKEFADAIAAAGNTPEERKKALNEKLAGGLGGEDRETYRRMKEARTDLESDVARQRQALDVNQFRQNRDYALQIQQFNIQSSRQKADLDKENARTQFDYTVARTKFEEDQAGKMAQKQYDLSRQFAAQSFQVQQNRAYQDYQVARGDRATDFGVSRGRSAEEFGISRSRSTAEFNLSRSRQNEDYQDNLQRSMMSGNVNGLDLLWNSRDFRKQQSRELADFQRSQKNATSDFQRSDRNATFDFNLANSRDARNLSISQERGNQDFMMQAQQAAAGRELELENHLYERKYESLELETQHARALEDINTAYQRLAQDIDMGKTQLANRGQDLAYDQNIANRDFGIDTSRKLRNSTYGFQDFAGSIRAKDPLAAAGQGAQDPFFASLLSANAQSTGQTDLFKQVNDAMKQNGIGNQVGDFFRTMFTNIVKESIQPNDPKFWSLNPLDWFRPTNKAPNAPDMTNAFDRSYQNELSGNKSGNNQPNVVIQAGGNTFQLDPGLTVSLQKYVDEENEKTRRGIEDLIQRYYGG